MTSDPDAELYSPLGPAPAIPPRRGSELVAGLHLLPEQRIRAFAADQLELLTRHWLHETLDASSAQVLRYGGTGDKGRDVVVLRPDGTWDNYQCKHYASKLTPSNVWAEVGKLVFYVARGAYTRPGLYTFVTPLGVSSQLRDVLNDSEQVRAGLRRNWSTYCSGLASLEAMRSAIDSFVFPTMEVATGETIIDGLKGTPLYPVFFGGGLAKQRPADKTPPTQIAAHEMPYLGELVDAYDDHAQEVVADLATALAHATYGRHVRRSRREFYCAESLREFSKDVLVSQDQFEAVQDEIFDGIANTFDRGHASGYDRVLAVCEQSAGVELSDHPLKGELRPADRSGICHQLANDGRLQWVAS